MFDDLCRLDLLDDTTADRFARRGHVVYESGDHGDTWLALGLLYVDPRRLHRAAARLAAKLRPYAADVVCGPLVGGALLGQRVAAELDVAFVYAEQVPTPAGLRYAIPRELRPLVRGRRVVIVDDAINAGSATLGARRAIEALGGNTVAVGSIIVRVPSGVELLARHGLATDYLVGLSWHTWPAKDCPLCRAGIPVESPG